MRYLVLATVLFAATASAQPTPGEPAIIVNGITTAEVWSSYAVNSPSAREQVLADLQRVCKSDTRSDRKRCARAWHIINTEYARLQESKAAQAE